MDGSFPLDRYLARIGLADRPSANLAGLRRLQCAQVRSIPFEGLDPFLGLTVSLEQTDIVSKLLNSPRGGYCFELNTLLQAALKSLGFVVTAHTARVRWNAAPESPMGPREHMVLCVETESGPFLADAGFGACLLDEPLPLTKAEHRTAMAHYRLEEIQGAYYLSANTPSGWRTAYVFDLVPQLDADFRLGNWYTSTHPDVPFKRFAIVERLAESERHKLVNSRYIVEGPNGVVKSETVLESPEKLEETLRQIFGISLPVPTGDFFDLVKAKESAAH